MNTVTRLRPSEWGVLLLLAFSILWKGGKSLEATWLVSGLAALLTLSYWFVKGIRTKDSDRLLELKQGRMAIKNELPLGYWIIALLYILFSGASYVFSETKNYGLDEIMRSTAYMLLFLWVARHQVEQDNTAIEHKFPAVVAWTTVISCIIGIFVYTLQPVNRFVGTFFDYRFDTDFWPNAWGEFLLIGWPMMLLLLWKQQSKRRMWLMIPLLGFIIGTLFLSYSRGSVLAFVAQIGCLFLLSFAVAFRDIRYKRVLKHTIKIVTGALLCTSLFAGITFAVVNGIREKSYPVESVLKKVTFTAVEGTSSINERASFWEQAFLLAQQKPIVGWGPYSFRFVQPQYMSHVLATSDHPHNALIKAAMERGFPVSVLFACIFGVVLALSILSFFTSRKTLSPYGDALTIVCATAAVGVLLHNFIDYNLQFVAIGLSTIICLGILVSPAKPIVGGQEESFRRWKIRKVLSRIDIIVSLLLLLITAWEGMFLVTSSLGRHAMAAGDSKRALVWFERSHLALFSRDLYLSEAELYMQQKEYDKAQSALDHYTLLNAHDPRVWKLQGQLSMYKGDFNTALVSLETAYSKGKFTDLGITRLLLEAARRTNSQTAFQARKLELDALYSDYAAAIEHNEHFIALSHNVEELQQLSRLMSQFYPIDSERYKTIARAALAHAKEERSKYESRTPGMLW